jgi:hypothetical protein
MPLAFVHVPLVWFVAVAIAQHSTYTPELLPEMGDVLMSVQVGTVPPAVGTVGPATVLLRQA